jgi:thiamine-phosphate pyrophosphorylase
VILHLVTDRRRLAPNADDETAGRCLVDQARFAAAAGLDVIQLRERDLEGNALVALARALVSVTRGSATRLVVNDRLDVALASRADGVHLRAESADAARIRSCTRLGFLIGRSVHSAAEAAAAGPVDYLIAGAIWPTSSKPADHPLLGTSGLAQIVKVAAAPVLAIGGVQPQRAGEVAGAGAAGIAAITSWFAEGGACRAIPLETVTQAFRSAYDAAKMNAGSLRTDGLRETTD